MNSSAQNTNKCCMNFCSCMIIMSCLIFLIIDFVYIGSLSDLNSSISIKTSSYYNFRCSEVCDYRYYYDINGQCCQYYDGTTYYYCTNKSSCINNYLSSLYSERDSLTSKIWIFSLLSITLFLVYVCFLCKICEKKNESQNPVYHRVNNANNSNNANNGGINRSQKSQKRINERYESFAYQDQQNTCCICLEQFKDEKAILLKCGHIYHSACIRDWSVKQQNCPVCRSSQ